MATPVSGMSEVVASAALLELTTEIVLAYAANNTVPIADLPGLIKQVHRALSGLSGPSGPVAPKIASAVPISKSISGDWLVCLFDGKKFKSLRRHLRASHAMSAQEYRATWGLPASYPMVSQNYSAKRSAMAKAFGLGRQAENPKRPKSTG